MIFVSGFYFSDSPNDSDQMILSVFSRKDFNLLRMVLNNKKTIKIKQLKIKQYLNKYNLINKKKRLYSNFMKLSRDPHLSYES